jgi:hypothetical protein
MKTVVKPSKHKRPQIAITTSEMPPAAHKMPPTVDKMASTAGRMRPTATARAMIRPDERNGTGLVGRGVLTAPCFERKEMRNYASASPRRAEDSVALPIAVKFSPNGVLPPRWSGAVSSPRRAGSGERRHAMRSPHPGALGQRRTTWRVGYFNAPHPYFTALPSTSSKCSSPMFSSRMPASTLLRSPTMTQINLS